MEDVWFELSASELAFLVQSDPGETSVLETITPLGAWFDTESVKSSGEEALAQRIKDMPVQLDQASWSRVITTARVLGSPVFASLVVVQRPDGTGVELITCVDETGATQLAVSPGTSALRSVPWPLPVDEMAADLAGVVAEEAGVSLRLLRNSQGRTPDGLTWSDGRLTVLLADGTTDESDLALVDALTTFADYAAGNHAAPLD
jgi:hypothetical protein